MKAEGGHILTAWEKEVRLPMTHQALTLLEQMHTTMALGKDFHMLLVMQREDLTAMAWENERLTHMDLGKECPTNIVWENKKHLD